MASSSKKSLKKHLSASGLLLNVCHKFNKISDSRKFSRDETIPLIDHLMAGLAVFGLKCPSLLDYDRKRNDQAVVENLRDLYHINTPPSDTYLRERLDILGAIYHPKKRS